MKKSKAPSAAVESKKSYAGAVTGFDKETNPEVIERRKKQIRLGKNTEEYKEYRLSIWKNERSSLQLPHTPNLNRKFSRRSWDAQIKLWKVRVHLWDKPQELASELERRKLKDLMEKQIVDYKGWQETKESVYQQELDFQEIIDDHAARMQTATRLLFTQLAFAEPEPELEANATESPTEII